MVLNTERLLIRYMEADDWKALMEIWKDFNGSEFAKYDVPHTTDEIEVREKVKHWEEMSPGKEHMFFAVCLEQQMIGYIDFHKNNDGYECGYCFHSRYQGMGYAKESLAALMKWLAGKDPVWFTAGTALKNLPSVRLLHSLGFQKIGEEKVSFYQDENGNDIYFDGGIFEVDYKGITS